MGREDEKGEEAESPWEILYKDAFQIGRQGSGLLEKPNLAANPDLYYDLEHASPALQICFAAWCAVVMKYLSVGLYDFTGNHALLIKMIG